MARILGASAIKRNTIEQSKRDAAEVRKKAFIDTIESEVLGPCPKPPSGGGKLCINISAYVSRRGDVVTVRDLHLWNKAEIEYALMVCRELNYKPKWD